MAWLEQAVERLQGEASRREVLLIQIDAFRPSPEIRATATGMPWYRQLTIPLEAVVGVRHTAQSARDKYEFPLLAKSLRDADADSYRRVPLPADTPLPA